MGGTAQAFKPEKLRDGMKLCELETMLRSQERPPGARLPPIRTEREFAKLKKSAIDQCDDQIIPPRRQMQGMGQPLTSLETALGEDEASPQTAASFHGFSFSPKNGLKRLMREMKEIAQNPHPMITVLPGEEDVRAITSTTFAPASSVLPSF